MRAGGPTARASASSRGVYPDPVSETPPTLARLRSLVQGFRSTQVTYVIAKLGLADQLAESPLTATELAARVNVDAPSLGRVLRLAAFYGLVKELPGDRFELTPLAELLRTGVEGSINATAKMLGEEHYGAWAELLHSVKTGEPAFDHVYGAPFFDYMAKHPETQATFDAAMSAGVDVVLKSLVDSYDFSRTRVVVDVGGGNGSLTAMIVKRFPDMQGVIYDQPQVLEAADRYLSEARVRDRFRLVPGNFFSSIPEGGDIYFLSNIVHDWDDERALRILQNVRAAMKKDATVLLLEAVLPEHGSPSPAAMADVNMLVLLTGRERTEKQFRTLLGNADLSLTNVIPIWERESLIEAKPR
jgi:SAM-dependent methyltransferase